MTQKKSGITKPITTFEITPQLWASHRLNLNTREKMNQFSIKHTPMLPWEWFDHSGNAALEAHVFSACLPVWAPPVVQASLSLPNHSSLWSGKRTNAEIRQTVTSLAPERQRCRWVCRKCNAHSNPFGFKLVGEDYFSGKHAFGWMFTF